LAHTSELKTRPLSQFQLAVLLHVPDEPADRAGAQPEGALRGQKILGKPFNVRDLLEDSTQLCTWLKKMY